MVQVVTPVILESPYGSIDDAVVALNTEYARACMRDCLTRGEAPYASHLLYTQPGVLDDRDRDDRDMGISAGFAWRSLARKTVVYVDRGVSRGMELGIDHARQAGHEVAERRLGGRWSAS